LKCPWHHAARPGFQAGGGIPEGRKFKAVQTGGPSAAAFPSSSGHERGLCIAGVGGSIMAPAHDRDGQTACMVDVAKFFMDSRATNLRQMHSCGGHDATARLLERISAGEER